MENWMTAAAIARSYMVGEERLLAYGMRGNLAFQRTAGGEILFDERAVSRIFRPRGAAVRSFPTPQGPSMGVLGLVRLGDKTSQQATRPELDARETRRRQLRSSSSGAEVRPIRKVG
jgi:hypothetical protein